MLINRYEYQPLPRVKTEAGRLYQTPTGEKLPSVTTILDKTADKTFLKEWRQRVGEKEATRIATTSAGLGTKMHKMLEDYVATGAEPNGNLFATAMAKEIIKQGLANVDELWGIEVGLYAQGLYGGTTDAVGIHKGTEAIVDFKNSRRLKREDWIGDYFLQAAAYALAHNEMFGTKIRKGVIMLATHEAQYQEFVIEGVDFDKAAEQWARRVEQYYLRFDK